MNFCSTVITYQKKSQEAYSSLEKFTEIERMNDLVSQESNSILFCKRFLNLVSPVDKKKSKATTLKSKVTKKSQPT